MLNINTAGELLNDFDFALLDSSDFKEDSVREELILPIIKRQLKHRFDFEIGREAIKQTLAKKTFRA